MEDRNLVAELWSHPLGKSWPPEVTVFFPLTSDVHTYQILPQRLPGWKTGMRRLVISEWIGQLSWAIIFSTSLSVAAFLRRAWVSMLARTGNHGRGVERRAPEMRRVVVDDYYRVLLMRGKIPHGPLSSPELWNRQRSSNALTWLSK